MADGTNVFAYLLVLWRGAASLRPDLRYENCLFSRCSLSFMIFLVTTTATSPGNYGIFYCWNSVQLCMLKYQDFLVLQWWNGEWCHYLCKAQYLGNPLSNIHIAPEGLLRFNRKAQKLQVGLILVLDPRYRGHEELHW